MRRTLAQLPFLLLLAAPGEAQQARAARFEIVSVGDTTIALRTGGVRWVKPGMAGKAVDPRRRDQTIATFRVAAVSQGEATAIVTGQTTALATDHVAVIEEPRRPWYRSGTFWSGLLVGAALGAGAALTK
jgi:hypothetical protein